MEETCVAFGKSERKNNGRIYARNCRKFERRKGKMNGTNQKRNERKRGK